jgi:hypothetical protein
MLRIKTAIVGSKLRPECIPVLASPGGMPETSGRVVMAYTIFRLKNGEIIREEVTRVKVEKVTEKESHLRAKTLTATAKRLIEALARKWLQFARTIRSTSRRKS